MLTSQPMSFWPSIIDLRVLGRKWNSIGDGEEEVEEEEVGSLSVSGLHHSRGVHQNMYSLHCTRGIHEIMISSQVLITHVEFMKS